MVKAVVGEEEKEADEVGAREKSVIGSGRGWKIEKIKTTGTGPGCGAETLTYLQPRR
jgi:hypothetical protein